MPSRSETVSAPVSKLEMMMMNVQEAPSMSICSIGSTAGPEDLLPSIP